RWLEVTVDGTTLTPRLELTTSAYAFRSQHADTAGFALNSSSTGDNLWSTDGTNAWRSGGNVGVGLANPGAKLHIVDMTGGADANFQFSGNVTSGYGASLSLDDAGMKIGHNSQFRDLQFQ